MKNEMNMKTILATAAASASLVTLAAGITHTSATSGNWSNPATWDSNGVPIYTGSETVNIKSHSVVYDGTDPLAKWYTLYIGSGSGSGTASYSQAGGTLTSTYLTEINSRTKDDRTGLGVMELTDVDARFESKRLVVGRIGGNAHLKMEGGSLTLDGSQLWMGVATKADAAPNRIELNGVAWTNLTYELAVGYSSAGTNIVHLSNSSLYSPNTVFGLGYGANGLGAVGQDYLIAENSTLSFGSKNVYLPKNGEHSAHLILSNSTLSCGSLKMGYVAGTTNYLAFIDSPPLSAGYSPIGNEPNTVNNILFKDLKAPKATAQTARNALSTRSVQGETRWYNFEYDNCDWTDSSAIKAGGANNVCSITFRNMTLPAVDLYASDLASGPGSLILSNCTWTAVKNTVAIAPKYGVTGAVRVVDSNLSGSTLTIADDNDNHEDQDIHGEFVLSGGEANFASQIQIRRGVGKLTLERGANLTCGAAYLPNMTGADATVEVGEDCTLLINTKLFLGNENDTRCFLAVKDGGRISLGDSIEACNFASSCSGFVWTMEGGEVDLGENYSAGFATANGSSGIAYLNGGIVKAKGFGVPESAGTQTVVFNGGKVQPTAGGTVLDANAAVRIAAGGAVFNVADGLSSTIASSLAHDAEAGSTDGGLVKEGAGDLVLSGANSTFNGPVRINAGTIKVSSSTALPVGSVVKIDASAGAVLTRSDKVAYPEGLSLEIVGGPLDGSKRYTLVENWSGELPQVTGLPQDWKVACKNGNIVASQVKGLLMMVR